MPRMVSHHSPCLFVSLFLRKNCFLQNPAYSNPKHPRVLFWPGGGSTALLLPFQPLMFSTKWRSACFREIDARTHLNSTRWNVQSGTKKLEGDMKVCHGVKSCAVCVPRFFNKAETATRQSWSKAEMRIVGSSLLVHTGSISMRQFASEHPCQPEYIDKLNTIMSILILGLARPGGTGRPCRPAQPKS